MKKALMILIAVTLVFSLGVAAVSAEDTGTELSDIPKSVGDGDELSHKDNTGETVVTYSIMSQTYSVTIPGDIDFHTLGTTIVKGNVTATDVTLKGGNYLSVTVNSTHDFAMVQHEDAEEKKVEINENTPRIEYTLTYTLPNQAPETITKASHTENGRVPIEVLNVTTGTHFSQTPLEFTKVGLASDLGLFKDTLTFTATVITPTATA